MQYLKLINNRGIMGIPVLARNSFLDTYISGIFYIALFTIAPDNEGLGGEEVGIITSPDYVRVPFGSWSPAALGIKSNSIIIRWPMTTSVWGIIVCAGLYSSATAGNFIARGDNRLNIIVDIGTVPRIGINELELSFSNIVN
jgi:hypothetical protein